MSFVVDIFIKGKKESLKAFDKTLRGKKGYSFSNIISVPNNIKDLKKWRQDNWGCFVDLNENETFEVYKNNGGEYIQYKFYSYLFGTPLRFIYECAKKYPELSFKIVEDAEVEVYSIVFGNGRILEEMRSENSDAITYIKYDKNTGEKIKEYYRGSGEAVPKAMTFIEALDGTCKRTKERTKLEKDLPF